MSIRRWMQHKIIKTPTILQLEATECGAAALSIILAYYGRYVPLTELRQACDVSRDGSSVRNIIKAAQAYGLESYLYRHDLEEIKSLKPPYIVFWRFNHFVVVEGFKKNKVYINNPATGRYAMSEQEFSTCFTGIALALEPSADFTAGGKKPNLSLALLRRLNSRKTAVLFLLISGLALILPGILLPLFIQLFIDNYLVLHQHSLLAPLLCGMLVTAAIRGTLRWLQSYYLSRFQTHLSLEIAGQFFWKALRLPLSYFTQRSAGDVAQRFWICDRAAQLISGTLLASILSIITVLFYSVVMCLYNFPLACICIFITSLNALMLYWLTHHQADISKRLSVDQGKLFGLTMNGLKMIESYKASGQENIFFTRWSGQFTKLLNAQQSSSKLRETVNCLSSFLPSLNTIVLLGLGGYAVMQNTMSLGELVAFQSLLASFTLPFSQLVSSSNKLQSIQGDLNRLDDVMNYPERPETFSSQPLETDRSAKLSGHLQIINLTFGYTPTCPPILQNFNLNLTPGKHVAIVGSSRSGRSTLAKLILGLYQARSGQILFDGQASSAYSKALFTNSVALVSQEVRLFEDTVRANLSLWDDTLSEEALLEATKDAAIHDIIISRKEGYDSIIQEAGINFSYGECQRLEIARALAVHPSLLILDEASSALDPDTEALIYKNLRRRACACVIIAHRLSSIRNCEEIIVLDKGHIVQRGTHEQLIKEEHGLYAKLVDNS